jgi:hypothetical protein
MVQPSGGNVDKDKTIQHFIGVHTGAEAVALEALIALRRELGPAADEVLAKIQSKLEGQYKNSDIAPSLELRHAEVVRPVLDEISRLFSTARASTP